MGLLSIIKKAKRKQHEMRILMLGLDNAGKTTVVKRFLKQDTSTISPTLGFNITPITFRGFTLNVWDIGGQKSLRSYWRNYYEATDGLVWVVDANDPERFEDCWRELTTLLQEERLAGASLLVYLNKYDIPTACTPEVVSEKLKLEDLRHGKRHVHVVRCSAITGEGLLEGMKWLADDISQRLYY